MKRIIILLVLMLLPSVSIAGVQQNAVADGSATVAGTDYLNGYSGTTSQRYTINSVLALKTQASLNIDDILTALGIADAATNFGAFTGSTIADNQTAKAAIQALETAVEVRVPNSLYDANTVVYATSDNTPAALTVTESSLVGRATGGNIAAIGLAAGLSISGGNLTIGTLNQNTTGSAATLTTARNIGDASFNGSAAITADAMLDNEDISPTGGTWILTALTSLSLPSVTMGSSATPLARIMDSDSPGADKEAAAIGAAYVNGIDGAENATASLYVMEAGTRTEYIQLDGQNTDVEINKTLALGANNLTMTGSIAATGARSTKGWFTDLESTNMPTVGGTGILSSLTAPVFSTSIEAPFLVIGSTATAADAGGIRLPNASYILAEADAAGTDVSLIGADSAEVVQIAASGASGVTITPATTITGNLTVNGGTFTMATANDPYLALAETDGTDWWIGADDTGNTLEFRTNVSVGTGVEMELNEDGSGVTFGDAGDDDFTFTVNANTSDGSFKWMEDENYWQFEDTVLLSGAVFAAGTQALSVTTEANIALTAPIVLITGDNDTDNDAIDLQNGTVTGQMVQFIGAATIDADDTITIAMTDTTCTNCPAIVFDKPGENASLTWTGVTWAVTGLQTGL